MLRKSLRERQLEENCKDLRGRLTLDPAERAERRRDAAQRGDIDWLADTEDYVILSRRLLIDPTVDMPTMEHFCLEVAARVETLGEEVQEMYDSVASETPYTALRMHETRIAFNELKSFFEECHDEFKRRFDPEAPKQVPPKRSWWSRLMER